MTLKVCLRPLLSEVKPENGLGRVVIEQYRRLPDYGIEIVDDPEQADLCVGHTHQFDMPRLDVMHCHGLYWTGDLKSGEYGAFHMRANAKIAEAARLAHTITVPSDWVAMPFQRDMRIDPVVIGHGLNIAEWTPGENWNYVLWNKNRVFDVCQPDAAYELARRGLHVVSTFGPDNISIPEQLHIIGKQPFEKMREYIRHAGIYLATVKETFGIGTLEAMACGVPVVGWDFGGTAELVTSGYDGLLVKPGDYDALYKAVLEAYRQREELGHHALETAQRYDWQEIIGQYANLYRTVHEAIQQERHGLSIVITTHNYARFVGEAVESALNQTRPAAEVIVVDDGSTDDTLQVLARYQGRIKLISQTNQGVAAARSAGIIAATQPYITLLDADDRLAPEFAETLLPAIDAQRDLGIVYSGLTLFNEKEHWLSEGFPPAFDWEAQAQPHNPPANCIPSACIFRREMWFRAGPHKQEYAPGEDAEFWTRGLALGFRALKASEAGLFWYRLHGDSATRRLKYKPIDIRLPWMRDKRYPLAAPSKLSPLIMSYSEPKVSVIIPVGPQHQALVMDAIDSLLGQTMREWECLVIDDTGSADFATALRMRYPFVRLIVNQARKAGGRPRFIGAGAGAARNAGLQEARAPLVLFLDADDALSNTALEEMLTAHVNSGGRYIYTDCVVVHLDGTTDILESADYAQRVWKDDGLHSVTALLPTDWARETLFNEALPTWEEGDFFTRLAQAGRCGQRLGRPLLMWRDWTGTRHKATAAQKKKALKHQAQFEGIDMSKCCGGEADSILAAKQALSGMAVRVIPEGRVRLEYTGLNTGALTFFGANGREYRGGNNDDERFADVDARDVQRLVDSGKWRVLSGGIVQAA